MKLKLFVGLFFTLIMVNGQGQSKTITGNWLLTLIETSRKTEQPYIVNRFDANGDISIYGTKIAGFTQRNQIIDLKSERFKIYNGNFHILKQTDKQLVLASETVTLHYKRAYDRLQNNPVYKNLVGTWLIHGTSPTYVRFEAGGRFVMLNIEENTGITTQGSWVFIPDEKAFVILADVDILNRKNSILQINKDYMEVSNNGIQYQLEKQPDVPAIKHLQIDEDTLTGPMEGQTGLPWTNDKLWPFLPKLKKLRYKRYVYYPEVKAFYEDFVSFDVIVNSEKQIITFNGYREIDEERIPFITRTKGPLTEAYNRFFPQKDLDRYSIIDRKRLWKLDDKTYECTVVNGIIGNKQYQYWMINTMPGVFAKVIYEKLIFDNEPEYIKYELDYIQKNEK